MNAADDAGRPIYLIGYRGTGKTSVARLLAQRLGREWFDVDAEIEKCAGCSIVEIFQREGEGDFRQLESDVLRRLTRQSNAVVSTGGGAVLRQENRRAMKETGFVVWLQASPETIGARLVKDPFTATSRPTLTGRPLDEEIRCLLEERDPCYREIADVILPTDELDPAGVADAIVEAYSDASQRTS